MAAIGAVEDAVAAGMTIVADHEETTTTIESVRDLLNTIATTALVGGPNTIKRTERIGIEKQAIATGVARPVPRKVAKAKPRKHSSRRMSVTREPFLSNSLPLGSEPKN